MKTIMKPNPILHSMGTTYTASEMAKAMIEWYGENAIDNARAVAGGDDFWNAVLEFIENDMQTSG